MAKIQEELELVDKFTSQFTRFITLAERAASGVEGIRDSLLNIETATAATATGVDRLAGEAGDLSGQMDRAKTSGEGLGKALHKLIGLVGGLSALKKALSLSDTLSSTRARLDMMNDGLQTTEELQTMLYQSAQRARGDYLETASFVAKLGNLAGSAFSGTGEIVAFAEQINKQIALSGASGQEAGAALLQLTQALSSGVLRGDELNSVMEQTPLIAKTIADSLGVSTGEMRELAAQGQITAQVVKNAILGAAGETDAAFAEMPKTWAQRWTEIKNIAVVALQPLLDALNRLANSGAADTVINGMAAGLNLVGKAAQFAADHMDVLGPIVGVAAAALAAYKIAATLAAVAQGELNLAMLLNPVGIVVALIVALIAILMLLWDKCEGFRTFLISMWAAQAKAMGVFYNSAIVPLANGFIGLQHTAVDAVANLASFVINSFADMAGFVLDRFSLMAEGAKGFARMYNAIAGVMGREQIDIGYAFSKEGVEAARADALAAVEGWRENTQLDDLDAWDLDRFNANVDALAGQAGDFRIGEFISQKIKEMAGGLAAGTGEAEAIGAWLPGESEAEPLLEDISGTLDGIAKSTGAANEDLKSLVDLAERQYVNRVNLTAQTPVITVNGQNTGDTAADRHALANAIRDILVEEASSAALRSTAMT